MATLRTVEAAADRHTVWQIDPMSHMRLRPIYTGTYAECLDALRSLFGKKWTEEHLGLVHDWSGRFVSWRV